MLVHRRKRPRYGIQAPLTSLIDIVFLLLIYFLLTTNFMVDEGIDVKLPQAEASRPQTRTEITVYVDAEGRAFLENTEMNLGELFKRLQELIGNAPDQMVLIKAERSVVLNKAVQVMDVAKAAGAGRLCLATEKGF
ncbi:ExbD/TolR-like biopolymer transport protein [uncultured Desulfatiglans sp.]|uniref:ExbD/TolR-like biopolymer transport protein n=1 Tax=Uncultured Desulfatiglans sp. TaxID=1748965 RepID=A0A653A291_UNCDX|nr:ExbD/TolR-like biopolymer transport protein [uncultured Desulfatiglans sp.]